jgi:hypothetical protein
MMGSMYQSLFTQYAAHLDADVDWATDWSADDELHSRTSDDWVTLSLVRGAGMHFGLEWMLEGDDEDNVGGTSEAPDAENGPAVAVGFGNGGVKWVGKVERTISKKAYTAAVSKFRAEKWKIWSKEVKANPRKYCSEATDMIKGKKNPLSASGEKMAIHHQTPLAKGGDPIDKSNLRFISTGRHVRAHSNPPYP